VEIDAVVRQVVSERQPDDDVIRLVALEHDAEPPHERRFRHAVAQSLPVYELLLLRQRLVHGGNCTWLRVASSLRGRRFHACSPAEDALT